MSTQRITYDDQPTRPNPFTAATMEELLTDKQERFIKELCKAKAVDPVIECEKYFRCEPQALSRRAASMFIDRLKALPDGPESPVAETLADLLLPKQLVCIRAVAHSQRVNSEKVCQQLFGCRPEELTRRAASKLIEHLKSLPSPVEAV